MVRKNSSKKSVKQTGEKPKPAVATSAAQDVAVLPLDVSKENLRELCSRSRSQSPTEIATTVTPSLAQLRIQRDSKSSKNSNDDGSKASAPCTHKPAVTDADRVPPRPESDAARAASVGSELQTASDGPQTAVSSGLQAAANEPQFSAPGELTGAYPAAAVGRLQSTSERLQTPMTSAGGPKTSECVGGETTAKTDKDLFRQFSTGGTPQPTSSGLQTTSGGQRAAPANESLKIAVGDDGPRTDAGELQSTSDGVRSSEAVGGQQRIENTRSLQTTLTANGGCSYRRSSDVSYMFSSFRTCTTTVQSSSGFLQGSNLRGLSERLQGSGYGENLHKLLQLNRQQLTATVADRRPKFKFTSRDVPVGSAPPASNLMYYMTAAAAASSSCRSAPHSERASPEHEPISAKEMLLKLFYGDTNAEPKLST